ncbi:MAG: hypothetical protein HQL56_15125 [Magnetococcales bacterium]|nr:hypothetical protein [Magnetococcales bacterium]
MREPLAEGQSVEAAMNRALAAEQAAEEAVEKCRLEADALLVEAQRTVRHIEERTDARMVSIRKNRSRMMKSYMKRTLQANPRLVEHPPLAESLLETTVAELARILTTPSAESP